MTEEYLERKRAKDREKRRIYRANMTDEQKERERQYQRDYYRRKVERERLAKAGKIQEPKPKKKTKAQIEREERAARKKAREEAAARKKAERIEKTRKNEIFKNPVALENAKARALGITYGKYQQLKAAGRLPENIDISKEVKVSQVSMPAGSESKKKRPLAEIKTNQMARIAAQTAERKRVTQAAIASVDGAAERYKNITNKNREAVANGSRRED